MLGLNKYIVKREYLTKAEQQLKHLQAEITSAKEYIGNIERGDLNVSYPGLTNNEIVEDSLSAALISMRDQLKVINEKEEQRKWITEGLNNFMVLLRQHMSIEDTCTIIISKIIKYINANQGGIYIANHEKEILELKAFYAYDRQKFLNQNFNFGEGLVGQVFLEKETQLLKRIPENYIRITSGLGDAPPSCIAIIPLKINDEVSGILELASFKDFEPYQIEFLEKLGENIASSVATLKNNEQTQSLLRQSQEQAEELRTQEEEMKQNMEEMQATQEELARKEAESKSVLEALNKSYYVAELDLNGKIISTNQLLKNLLEKSNDLANLEGALYTTLGYSEEGDSQAIIEKVKAGTLAARTSSYKINEMEIWLSETYSPIYDAHDSVRKILMIASDITNEKIQREELEKNAIEIKEIREKEKARADHSIQTQTKMMERYMKKAKDTETQLKAKIKELESQLNQINQS